MEVSEQRRPEPARRRNDEGAVTGDLADLTPGRKFGRYVLQDKLGQGGMATVFKAHDPELNREVAVKVLPWMQAAVADTTLVDRFQQEAQSVVGLNHAHIIQVYDVGEDSGFLYIVMEYLSEGTLQGRMGKKLSIHETTVLMGPIAQALDTAHSQGILHRDIKPANILLDAGGNPKLADFGIAKVLEATTRFTRTSQQIGTSESMTPEQAMGADLDRRSDLYALAVVIFQMLL